MEYVTRGNNSVTPLQLPQQPNTQCHSHLEGGIINSCSWCRDVSLAKSVAGLA